MCTVYRKIDKHNIENIINKIQCYYTVNIDKHDIENIINKM